MKFTYPNTTLAALAQQLGGLPKSDAEALKLYRNAADQGHAHSASNLGVFYKFGRGGLRKSDVLAVHWWRKAAEQVSL